MSVCAYVYVRLKCSCACVCVCVNVCVFGCFLFVVVFQYSRVAPRDAHRAQTRILSFCSARDLKTVEAVCKLTNNKAEIRNIVAVIRRGLVGTKSAKEIAEIRAALIHLCYMTENLKHQADVSM